MTAGLGFGSGAFVSAIRLFSSADIAKAGTLTSGKVIIKNYAINGNFSLALKLVGAGQVDVKYQLSPDDNATYVTPSAGTNIATNFTVASGTSGFDIIGFTPEVAPFLKVSITEDNVGTAVIDGWLLMA